jgi:hypothetical protein
MPFVEHSMELEDVSKYGARRIAQPLLAACNRVYKRDSQRRSRLLACSWTRLLALRGVGNIVDNSAAALHEMELDCSFMIEPTYCCFDTYQAGIIVVQTSKFRSWPLRYC